jgi:hypothetical protein
MPYSSSLSDPEWEILEPLLKEILYVKKQTRPSNWTKREIFDGILYQLKNGCPQGRRKASPKGQRLEPHVGFANETEGNPLGL